MLGFLIGMAVTLLCILVVVRLGGSDWVIYVIGRLPWIHRVDGEALKGNSLVRVSCPGKGQVAIESDSRQVAECCIERIIEVPNRKVRVGCHGRYTIGQARFLGRTFGGDPVCGGGIKHVFLSRTSELIVRLSSFLALRRGKSVSGFVVRRQDGDIGWSSIYVGDRTHVEAFLQLSPDRLLPAVLRPAA